MRGPRQYLALGELCRCPELHVHLYAALLQGAGHGLSDPSVHEQLGDRPGGQLSLQEPEPPLISGGSS